MSDDNSVAHFDWAFLRTLLCIPVVAGVALWAAPHLATAQTSKKPEITRLGSHQPLVTNPSCLPTAPVGQICYVTSKLVR
jgi:hypothetical protein